jgi:cell wall assembly regulator SMI1
MVPMPEHPSITHLFTDFQAWLTNYAPDVTFRPPAKPSSLDHFSAISEVEIPHQLRQILLVADGETHASAGVIGNWRLMPIAEIQAAWGLLTKLAEKGAFGTNEPKASPYIRNLWWHPGWVPFVSSGTGYYYCIDTDPIKPERKGQVVLFLQGRPERPLVAANLSLWFERILKDLKSGIYQYDPEMGFNGEGFMWSALEGKHLLDIPGGKLIA